MFAGRIWTNGNNGSGTVVLYLGSAQKLMFLCCRQHFHELLFCIVITAKPVWEAEMMKHFEEQIETNMKETKQEWEALKQTELEQIQENLRREYQEEYNKVGLDPS